ncbi:MAG: ABC transporter permease [Planctomycetaceae bacterium]
MRYLGFVLANLRRNRLRTALTVLGIAVAILLFCSLEALLFAFRAGADVADASRLVTRNKVSLVQPLPLAYRDRIARVDNVKDLTYANWFGGVYEARKEEFFGQFAVEAESYLRIHPEYRLGEEARATFLRERNACLLGRKLAVRLGKREGDMLVLKGSIFAGQWEFVVRGVFEVPADGTNENQMFFHWAYLDEGRDAARRGQVGILITQLADPSRAAATSAAIDAQFESSAAATRTETERAYRLGFFSMYGNVTFLLRAIGAAVVFTILLVGANTMMMSARERTAEVGTLKTIGFPDRTVFLLAMAEASFISLVGGALGCGLALQLLGGPGNFLGGIFPGFRVSPATVLIGMALSLATGLVSGFVPAFSAARLRAADALRRI